MGVQIYGFSMERPPVLPLLLLKGTHHRSEFHGERVCFLEVRMSAILKKRSVFGLDIRIFWKRGSIFSILNRPLLKTQHFVEKGSLLSPQMFFPHCESQCFVE